MSNSMKISGFYSGFDTDAIVKSLMEIEQLKVDRQFRSRVNLEWKQEALNDVGDHIKTFKNTYLSVLGASNMYSKNTYNVYDVTMTGANASAVTIKADYSASAGTHQIDEVEQLAKASSASSSGTVSNGGELSATNSTKLKDLDFNMEGSMFDADGKVSFIINGEEFTFSQEDTLQKLINTINSNDKAGVTFNYSRLTDKFTITSQRTGADSKIEITNGVGKAFGADGAFKIAEGTKENGQDAIVKFVGATEDEIIKLEQSSNTFTIDGITYTLNGTTEAGANISFRLTQNVDKAVEGIKGFVDAYNALVLKLDTLLAERKSRTERGYHPLTDAEKEAMSDKEIEKWEEVAKKGMLYNDRTLSNLLDNLRKTLYATVADAGLSPAQLGIKTGDWRNKGQITLDENALRVALEKNPHQVMTIFTNISSSESVSTAYSENGLLKRISDVMDSYTKSTSSTMSTLTDNIKDIYDRMEIMENKMGELEERYYQKYAAMETALSRLQSQSNWLSSMMGSIQ